MRRMRQEDEEDEFLIFLHSCNERLFAFSVVLLTYLLLVLVS